MEYLKSYKLFESVYVKWTERRLHKESPKDKIEDVVNKLGLDLKWDDIFIKTDSYI